MKQYVEYIECLDVYEIKDEDGNVIKYMNHHPDANLDTKRMADELFDALFSNDTNS